MARQSAMDEFDSVVETEDDMNAAENEVVLIKQGTDFYETFVEAVAWSAGVDHIDGSNGATVADVIHIAALDGKHGNGTIGENSKSSNGEVDITIPAALRSVEQAFGEEGELETHESRVVVETTDNGGLDVVTAYIDGHHEYPTGDGKETFHLEGECTLLAGGLHRDQHATTEVAGTRV